MGLTDAERRFVTGAENDARYRAGAFVTDAGDWYCQACADAAREVATMVVIGRRDGTLRARVGWPEVRRLIEWTAG